MTSRHQSDAYWDMFVNTATVDPNNLLVNGLRGLPDGTVYPVKTDIHSPEIMSEHVKELALFLGADRCGIVALGEREDSDGYPFAVVCVLKSEFDPEIAEGIGGQLAALKGAYVTFNLGGWIRECGYRATREGDLNGDELAALAGQGRVDERGRLVAPNIARHVHVAQVIRTDLPLAPDGQAAQSRP